MGDKQVAVVTGASRGIGQAIALEMAGAGYHVVGISRTCCEAFTKSIEAKGVESMALQADISDLDRHRELVDQIDQRFGRIDLLVNNAGVAPLERKDLLETGPESFDRVLSINLRFSNSSIV